MKRRLGDGREVLILEPRELLRRLATLVPPPRAHLVRYHGVFGPASKWRREIVPAPAQRTCLAQARCSSDAPDIPSAASDHASSSARFAHSLERATPSRLSRGHSRFQTLTTPSLALLPRIRYVF